MNISLPETLMAFIDKQVARGGYGSSSEYVRELIRRERDRQGLRKLLIEGASTAPTAPVDEAYFSSLRKRARNRTSG